MVNVRNLTVRERLLRMIVGKPQKLTIIVPGGSVQSVDITEIGGADHETV